MRVVLPGAQIRRSQVDQQNFGILLDREGYRALIRDPDTVTLRQDDVIDGCLAAHGMEPGSSIRRERVDEVMAGIEHGRADQDILVYSQGSLAAIRGHHNAQQVVALRLRETPLLVIGVEPCLG